MHQNAMLQTEIRRARFAQLLPALRDPEVHMCVVLAPSFTPYVDWTLFRDSGTWRVRRYVESVLRGPKQVYFSEGLPDARAVESLMAGLPELTLPAFDTLPATLGIDGCTVKIEVFKGAYRSAGLCWWSSAPDADPRLLPVRRFTQNAIDLFQACLPECTLDLKTSVP